MSDEDDNKKTTVKKKNSRKNAGGFRGKGLNIPDLKEIQKSKMSEKVIGFDADEDNKETTSKKKKHSGRNVGGFQGMGLSYPVLKGIQKRGYKIPTPIQRKTIPLILDGRDVVAMARTGSGKTACFLIPLFEKLKMRVVMSGVRALVLSPTRELALQTLKFIKELGKFTDLKTALILGGDSMESQFGAVLGNPDIIVATPGRFMHICVEMELKLNTVEYVVFDEADRLFEMGFGDQLHDIVSRLPDTKQTLLFSATIPKVLVDFAKAGLNDPVLLRLDVETKLPQQLKLAFLCCRIENKEAALLYLLKHHIKPKSQTVVFVATRHHVDYLHMILGQAGITSTFIYSNLDPSARKINVAKFQKGIVSILVVTDVAARGIDIPQLDYVINYNFPEKSKLFLHRVGRCARAGRNGIAYSLISRDEYAYLLDLHLFLSRPFITSYSPSSENAEDEFPDSVTGTIPDYLLQEEQAQLINMHELKYDLVTLKKVCENSYSKYSKVRQAASLQSIKRAKDLNHNQSLAIHPLFSRKEVEQFNVNVLEQMKNYKPNVTVFETGHKTRLYGMMKETRKYHGKVIEIFKQKRNSVLDKETYDERRTLKASTEDDIEETFHSNVILPKKHILDPVAYALKQKKKNKVTKDENYIPYRPVDHHSEMGLAVNNFSQEASKVNLDLTTDEGMIKKKQNKLHWDRKKKKMIGPSNETKKIRNEAGVWIPATYKSDRYARWKEKAKIDVNPSDNEEDDNDGGDVNTKSKKGMFNKRLQDLKTYPNTHWGKHNKKIASKVRDEMKGPDSILKARIQKELRQKKEARKAKSKKKKRK